MRTEHETEIKHTCKKLKSSSSPPLPRIDNRDGSIFYTAPDGTEYSMQKLCGEGGAKVYEFKNKAGKRIAIKLERLDHETTADKDIKEHIECLKEAAKIYQYVNEAYAEMFTFVSKNSVKTLFVTDYIEGKNFYRRIKEGFKTPAELLQLLKKVVIAIGWLNLDRKVLHGNLSPENIMLNTQEQVIFIDFDDSKENKDDSSQLTPWLDDAYCRPFIISLPILSPAIKTGLIDFFDMIKRDESGHPSKKIFFDLVIEELDSLIAMIPFTQSIMDAKVPDKIKQDLKERKILQKAIMLAIRSGFKKEAISDLLREEKLDLVSKFYQNQTFCEALISAPLEIIEMVLAQLKKETQEGEAILLEAFQNADLDVTILENFKHIFPLQFKERMGKTTYEARFGAFLNEPEEITRMTFLAKNGATVPYILNGLSYEWNKFSQHDYKSAWFTSKIPQLYCEKRHLDFVINHIKKGTYKTHPQFLTDINAHFPELYARALATVSLIPSSDSSSQSSSLSSSQDPSSSSQITPSSPPLSRGSFWFRGSPSQENCSAASSKPSHLGYDP